VRQKDFNLRFYHSVIVSLFNSSFLSLDLVINENNSQSDIISSYTDTLRVYFIIIVGEEVSYFAVFIPLRALRI
jgi:hypothetical protein